MHNVSYALLIIQTTAFLQCNASPWISKGASALCKVAETPVHIQEDEWMRALLSYFFIQSNNNVIDFSVSGSVLVSSIHFLFKIPNIFL